MDQYALDPNSRIVITRTPPAVLALCFLTLVLEGYDLLMFGSVVPSLLAYEPWGLSPAQVGLLGSATVAGMLVGAVTAAGLSDRIGRRRILLGSMVVFSLSMGLAAVAPTVGLFGTARLLIGIGAGAFMPTAAALLFEYSPVDGRNRAAGLGFSGTALGGLIAAGLGAILVPIYGFRIMFVLGCLPLLLLFPAMLRWLPESVGFLMARGRLEEAASVLRRFRLPVAVESDGPIGPAEPAIKTGPRALLAQPYRRVTVLFWVATAMCLLVTFGVNAWLPTLMQASGYTLASALIFQIVLNVGSLFGAVAVGLLADRFGGRPVAIVTFGCAAVTLAALSTAPPVAVGMLLVALGGVGTIGTQIVLNTLVGASYPTVLRATALGMSLGVGRIGGIVGPAYGGIVVGLGLGHQWGFFAFVLPALIGALAVGLVPAGLDRARKRFMADRRVDPSLSTEA